MFTPIDDIKLQTIDFNWIKQTTKISHLKRAIRLIQMDGNYFTQLKQACYNRIGQLDPLQKRIIIDNRMTQIDKQLIDKQLEEWQNQLNRNKQQQKGSININKNHEIFEKTKQKHEQQQQFDPQSYFNQDKSKQNKRKLAQNEKNKGNQSIKSKDYIQAIKYYTNSIKLDPTLSQSYVNRALAYLKIKQFQKALQDCQHGLRLNPKYTKAYHRKAKALIGLKNKVQAYNALQQAIKIEPDNSQCLAELKQLRQEMNQQEKGQLQGKSKFKKVVIQQDSDQEDEQIKEK